MTEDELKVFLDKQLDVWPLASKNFEAVGKVDVRTFNVDGMPVRVQFNPSRIQSTSAKTDEASIRQRKCFLCAENRPAEQMEKDMCGYTLLVNPFPIFPRHFTIASHHTPQRIEGRVSNLIAMAKEMPGYTVFYNGPRCGASAPDHLHFQAGNSDFLPLNDVLEKGRLELISTLGDTRLYLSDCLPLKFFLIEGKHIDKMTAMFERLYCALPKEPEDDEPKLNLLCREREGQLQLMVIPRKKHRPDFYGSTPDSFMISPASVDLAGVIITPRQEDFVKIDENKIREIFAEVCLDSSQMRKISEKV